VPTAHEPCQKTAHRRNDDEPCQYHMNTTMAMMITAPMAIPMA
jgi:hypothetical protein